MEDLKDRTSLMGPEGRVGLARSLVAMQLKIQLGTWDDFVRIMIETTDLTKAELEDARKFLEDLDDSEADTIGEEDDTTDRKKGKGN